MQRLTTNMHIYTLKSANSATPTLTTPLTPYHSPHYDLHKYTEAKNLLKYRKLNTEQKFSLTFSRLEQSAALYNKTILVFKVFVCGGGVLNKQHTEHCKGSYNCL